MNSDWSTVSSAIESLTDEKSPYVGLVTIIEEHETLDDTQWASIQEELSECFGKDLAVAASRGRLTFGSQEAAAETPLQIVTEETGQQVEEQEDGETEEQEVQEPEEQTVRKTA